MPRYRFGDTFVDTDNIEVIGPNGACEIEPQAFDVLRYLIEQPGRLITKEELLDNVWGDRFVSESALTTRIKQARRALGDDGRRQWAIKTVHGRGYRFVARDENETLDVPSGSSQPVPPVEPLPDELRADARHMFVGRVEERERALGVVSHHTQADSFGWVWLLGEPGIGKTRLAAEVAKEAQGLGHVVLFGRNNEDLRVPYQPFIEVIRSSIESLDEAGRAAVRDAMAPDLAPLLPAGLQEQPAHDNSSLSDDETRRYRLFEAVADWLADRAEAAPVTMIIDDVHWATDSTLQLLSHLQSRKHEAPVTLVLTARDTAPDINRKVLDLIAAGQAQENTAVVRLAGLSDEEARRFVGADVDFAEVMRQTDGNPLLLQAVDESDGSVDIRSAVHRRLASLDAEVHDVLQVASLLGLEFSLAVAATAMGRDELEVLTHLEHAIAARLLDDIGTDRFRFTHALIRSSLRDDLSSPRRARMHRDIAAAINSVSEGPNQHLQALAFHTAEAAVTDPSLRPKAIDHLEEAARESMRQLSFDEAAASYARAAALLDRTDIEQRTRLLLEQGIAETRAGANMTAAKTFEQCISNARMTGDSRLFIEAAIRFEDASWRPGQSGLRALDILLEATALLDAAVSSGERFDDELELRTRLAVAQLRAHAMSGHVEESTEAFESANLLVRELGSATLEAGLINVYVSQVLLFRGLLDTLPIIARLTEIQPLIEDNDVALHAAHVRVLHAGFTGDFEESRRLAGVSAILQERSHSNFWKFIRHNQEAMEAFYLGDLDVAERLAEECLALADSLPEEDGSGIYGLRMFMIRREQDRLSSMAPLIRRIVANADVDGIWTPGLALLLAETGSTDEAIAALAPIRAASFDLPVDAMWSTVMALLIETTVRIGDTESCEILRTRLEHLAETNIITGSGLMCFGRADRLLGMLSLQLGEIDRAESEFGTALEADSAGGSTLWANESRLWLSHVRRAQGHAAEADAMLTVVERMAKSNGHLRLLRLAQEAAKTR